ncbi:sensor histidine kinase [Amycolatopsis sp. 195334CR]|uniref:sensor histidine kinase n=1 Tax=Amycolatopsis sp. 195334CR TaxID=2814588 RepID=UPI0027DC6C65|nr:sensor histidine kinase [Amycolatopsis sp. 195334CR]
MFSHPALFYRGRDEFLAGTVPFVTDGLAAGEPVAAALPGEHLTWLSEALDESARQRVRLIDMTEAGRNPGRIIPGVLRDFADRHEGPVRLIGEPIWPGRTPVEYAACAQHEALINLSFSGRAGAVLCPYDAEGLEPWILDEAACTHPELRDHYGTWASKSFSPEQVVDRYNQPFPAPADIPWVLSFDRTGLSGVRRFAGERAAAYGLGGDRVLDLTLVVGELCANSLRHGRGSGVLRVWREDDSVICEIRDAGHITDPLAGRRPATPSQPNGRGLLMVNFLSDLVRVHTGPDGTQTRIYFRLVQDEARAAVS